MKSLPHAKAVAILSRKTPAELRVLRTNWIRMFGSTSGQVRMVEKKIARAAGFRGA